jgi:hypothetical protein
MRLDMSTFKKWAPRGVIAVLVVWLVWLTAMQVYLNSKVVPLLSETDILKVTAIEESQILSLQKQIQALQASSTPSQ